MEAYGRGAGAMHGIAAVGMAGGGADMWDVRVGAREGYLPSASSANLAASFK